MMKTFTYNGLRSKSFGVYISGSGTYNSPARAYEAVQIPGRNGDLLMPEKRLGNVTVTYPCFILDDFGDRFGDFKSALLGFDGYKRLTDDYDTTHYRQAYLMGDIQPEMQRNLRAGSFTVTFSCKPQRWLLAGNTDTSITSSGETITNPTRQTAKPKLTITGSGTVTINGITLTIALPTAVTRVVIDCETCEAMHPTLAAVNLNQYVSCSSQNFPYLLPGNNVIAFEGVTQVDITPRWFDL